MNLIDKIKDNTKKLALAGALGSSLYLSGCIVHGSPREMSNFVVQDFLGLPGLPDKNNTNQNQYNLNGNVQNSSPPQNVNQSASRHMQGSSNNDYRKNLEAPIIDNGPQMDYFFECNFYNGDSNNNRLVDLHEFSEAKSTFHRSEPITFVFRA